MDWQLLSVACCVAGAVSYLAWTALRTWRGRRTGCGRGCACGPKEEKHAAQDALISPDELTLRRHRE